MITIINYKAGNIRSIQNMLKKLGVRSIITDKIEEIENAEKLILPGVGHFDHGMKNLRESNLIETLNRKVLEDKVPILGICLGAQLLGDSSEEGTEKGLGWIPMEIVKFDKHKLPASLKIPHMGWNHLKLNTSNEASALFSGLTEESRFYFVHSYYMQPKEERAVLSTTNYGVNFTSSVSLDNIYGVQFHPEKSHVFGMHLLRNFAAL